MTGPGHGPEPANAVFVVEVAPAPAGGARPAAETYGVVAPDREAALAALAGELATGGDVGLSLRGELDAVSAGIFSFDLDRPGQVKRIMRHAGHPAFS